MDNDNNFGGVKGTVILSLLWPRVWPQLQYNDSCTESPLPLFDHVNFSSWVSNMYLFHPQMLHSENNINYVFNLLTRFNTKDIILRRLFNLFWKGATRQSYVASSHGCSSNIATQRSTRDRRSWWCSAEGGSACHLSRAQWLADLPPCLFLMADPLVTVLDKKKVPTRVNNLVKFIRFGIYSEYKEYIPLILHWDSKLNPVWCKLFRQQTNDIFSVLWWWFEPLISLHVQTHMWLVVKNMAFYKLHAATRLPHWLHMLVWVKRMIKTVW